jgi:23S rRNA (cytidine1920-2'-O)/16S rRNA (cytidine1409-2'-O)-methyltransferase
MKRRLDQVMAEQGMVASRSQAESYIKLGQVTVGGQSVTKPGYMVGDEQQVKLLASEQYVSRAALKLASVSQGLDVTFRGKAVLDVGSSTGGFTQYALKQGASKLIAVEVGKDQLHPTLRNEPRIELYEQTDIRDMLPTGSKPQPGKHVMTARPDIVVADVSFISLREILPHVAQLCGKHTDIVAMVKPQFEAGHSSLKHKGVIKNDRMRRDILQDFESWAKQLFVIVAKADSDVAGAKGNLERFYLLRKRGSYAER